MTDHLYTNRGCRIQVKSGRFSIAVTVQTTVSEKAVLRLDQSSAMALAKLLAEAAEGMNTGQDTKYCPSCHKTKLLGEFYNDRSRADGHSGYCSQCKRELTRPVSRSWYWRHKAELAKERAA